MWVVMLISMVLFGLAMLCLGLGVLLRGRCLRGSCGGSKPIGPDGQPLTCGHCTCDAADDAAKSAH